MCQEKNYHKPWRQIKSSHPDEDGCLKLSQQIINVAFCVQHSADFHDVAYDYIKNREVPLFIDTVIRIGSVL